VQPFDLFALCDVARHRVRELLLHVWRRVPQQPFITAVGAAVAVLERNRRRAFVDSLGFAHRGFHVVRMHKVDVRLR
jgi:hypothetical protein